MRRPAPLRGGSSVGLPAYSAMARLPALPVVYKAAWAASLLMVAAAAAMLRPVVGVARGASLAAAEVVVPRLPIGVCAPTADCG